MALWSALALLGLAAAVTPVAADDGFVNMQIVHSTNTNYFGKRAVELGLANRSDVAYYAKLNFGTPAQAQYVQLDTGSFELWVNPTCTGLATSDAAFCDEVGFFNTSASSTVTSLGTTKKLQYGIGSANVSYVLDTVGLPGSAAVLEQVQFGVASATTDEFAGILGLGFGDGLGTSYPNFVDVLQAQNVTQVKAFTVALGSKTEQEGVVIFGGIDTSKFSGPLTKLPIVAAADSPDGAARYWINLSSVSLSTAASAYANSSLQVFLDSGSTLILLPELLVADIAADFVVVEGPTSSGYYYVDCDAADANGSLDFTFDSVTIRIPYSELIRQSGSQCMLGIEASSEFALLGDTFLRSAYVVIDQTDDNVWMAPYENCGSSPAALAAVSSLTTVTGKCSSSDKISAESSSSAAASSSSSSSLSAKSTTAASASTTAAHAAASSPTSSTSQPSASSTTVSSSASSPAARVFASPWTALFVAALACLLL